MEKEREPALLVSGELLGTCKAENAWQGPAAIYKTTGNDQLAVHRFVGADVGLSHNNRRDLQGALQTLTHIAAGFKRNFRTVPYIAVGVKHGSPCSAGIHDSSSREAIMRMIMCRPETIFGGTVMTNFVLDGEDADALSYHAYDGKKRVLDVVAAAHVTACARRVLGRAGDRCHFLENRNVEGDGAAHLDTSPLIKYARGEVHVQSNYTFIFDRRQSYVSASSAIEEGVWRDLVLAWAVGSTSPSNTITLARDGMIIANAVGQHDRVVAAKLALLIASEAQHLATGSCAYSDSFFPFTDAPRELINAGVTSMLVTSGSIRDGEVFSLIGERGVQLVTIPDSKGRGFYGH